MAEAELHLFVLWEKARFAEKRILADMARTLEIVCTRELRFADEPMLSFRRFYGPSLPDARRKLRSCGGGAFLLVVVRDRAPAYGKCTVDGFEYQNVDMRLVTLKGRYRNWAGRRHRVHGTTTRAEFARDVLMLTGHSAEEWEQGVPEGEWRLCLPSAWSAESGADPFHPGVMAPGTVPAVENARVFLENRYINDRLQEGTFRGTPCIEKRTSKATWSAGNEYRLASRMYVAAPTVVPRPLAWQYDCDAHAAAVIIAKVAGPSLTELDLGVCRYVIPEVLVYVTRETGAVKGLWASRAQLVGHALEGTGIFHNIIPRHNLDGRDGFLLNFLGIDTERCGQKEEKQSQKVCPESFHTVQM